IPVIVGNDADNTLVGGPGNDIMIGLGGNDTFVAGDGNDVLDGEGGFNIADFSTASAAVNVNLQLWAVSIAPHDIGGGPMETMAQIFGVIGTPFDATLMGRSVTGNLLSGGAGDDLIQGGAGNDTLDGGSGFNILSYANAGAGVTVDLSVAGPQNTGGAGTDTL